jgi:hypothetical protein
MVVDVPFGTVGRLASAASLLIDATQFGWTADGLLTQGPDTDCCSGVGRKLDGWLASALGLTSACLPVCLLFIGSIHNNNQI